MSFLEGLLNLAAAGTQAAQSIAAQKPKSPADEKAANLYKQNLEKKQSLRTNIGATIIAVLFILPLAGAVIAYYFLMMKIAVILLILSPVILIVGLIAYFSFECIFPLEDKSEAEKITSQQSQQSPDLLQTQKT